MTPDNGTPVRRLLSRVGSARTLGRLGSLLDELEVGLVAVHADRDTAQVSSAAAGLLGMRPGTTSATEFGAVIETLAARALNPDETVDALTALQPDSDIDFRATWAFSGDHPSHLGVVSKPAPWSDGRIWAFYDNSRVAQAIDAVNAANALVRATTEAMFDPQVLLEGVWRDGEVVDLIYREVNQATCDYLGLSRAQLLGHSLLESLPNIEGSGLLAHYTRCAQTGEPAVLDAFPYYNELLGAARYYDVRGNQVRPGWMALTWRDVTERFEMTQQIARSERRLNEELSSAAAYVASILPADLDGPVQVSSRFVPCRHLGGDSYDYVWIDDDHLVAYLVDVSGHGVGPAMMSVSVHNLLRSGTLEPAMLKQPAEVLAELNRLFPMERQAGNYFTIWYGVYQASTRTLRYSSAGHPPALVFSAGEPVARLATDSIPVGVEADTEFTDRGYPVPPGADILLYSDGAFELTAPGGRQWTLDGFTKVCARIAATPGWTLDTLIAAVLDYVEDEFFEDDCTLVRLHIT